jgi:hypothetical protein
VPVFIYSVIGMAWRQAKAQDPELSMFGMSSSRVRPKAIS